MSVPLSKRKESIRNYVTVSESLYKECLKVCLKMPRRYTNLILSPIIEIAGRITDNLHRANKVFLTEKSSASDAKRRLDYISLAIEDLEALSFRINVFLYMPEGISYYDPKTRENVKIIFSNMEGIAGLIDEEERILTGLRKHDKEYINRFKLLQH